MKIEEYLNKVTEQIRCEKAHESVKGELQNHILDQMEAYKLGGMEEEEALEKAVLDMGDPVEVGNSFDRIHRPQVSWGMLVLVGIISILSIVFQVAFQKNGDVLAEFTAKRQIFFIVAGYVGMLAVYYLDYSFLGRYATIIGTIFLGFILISSPFQRTLNGSTHYLYFGGISLNIPILMCLFIPIFGGILFQYRGQGYRAIWKSILWMVAVVALTLSKSLPYTCCLSVTMLALFVLAVWKDWFKVNKKLVLGAVGGILAGGLLLGIGSLVQIVQMDGILPQYQTDRLRAFVTQSGDANYVASIASQILENSRWFGADAENVEMVASSLPGAGSELILVSIVAYFGILAGIVAVGLMLYLFQKIFRISFAQKNQLGMIVGCGCGMILGIMSFFGVIQSLTVFPITSIILPFFSNSGSGTLVLYVLLGIVLSIYRYQNIPRNQCQTKRKRLRIRFE